MTARKYRFSRMFKIHEAAAQLGGAITQDYVPGPSTLPVSSAHYHDLFSRSFVPTAMFFIIYSLLTIATTSQATTCGYKNGDPQSARTAQSGYRCRVDTANGLWGFCPTTVISAADCGLAGVCVDNHSCTDGCGRLTGRVDIATFSWSVTYVIRHRECN